MIRICLTFLACFWVTSAAAQSRQPSHCIALAEAAPGLTYLHRANYAEPVAQYSVRLTYVDHATFLIQTQKGTSIATDFTGFLGVTNFVPDVVTMNHAHDSHWTSVPDPRIPHVLEGWGHAGEKAHYLELEDVLIRNVPTNIRSRFGGGVEVNGNSIFVFEAEGLCIGHLGHLHHEPTPEQYASLGRLDVVMAPVDGGMTLDRPTLVRMLKRLRSSIVIPMHWFGPFNLDAFLIDMATDFEIERTSKSSVEISLASLPKRPKVLVLQQKFLQEFDE